MYRYTQYRMVKYMPSQGNFPELQCIHAKLFIVYFMEVISINCTAHANHTLEIQISGSRNTLSKYSKALQFLRVLSQ